MNGARMRQKALSLFAYGFFVLLTLAGCVKYTEGYHSVKLSDRIPANRSSARNPVIIIHGLFGAELFTEQGEQIWGKFSNQRITDREILMLLAQSKLKAGPILTHSEISPADIPVYRFKNYSLLINELKKFGYSDREILPFAYDWRRSVPENVVEFHKFMLEQSKKLPANCKFDVIAHSMGGLLLRYYLQYGIQPLTDKGVPQTSAVGREKISKVFIFGTPNCGYTDTLYELHNGLAFIPAAAKYPPLLLLTFKSYFCMFPPLDSNALIDSASGQPINFYDIETWKKLPLYRNASPEIIELLKENLALARNFRRALDNPVKPIKGIKFYLFAGNAFDTVKQCKVNIADGKAVPVAYAPGDGKILLESAIADKLIPWDGIYVFGASHMGLFVSKDAMRNLNFLLCHEVGND